MVCRRRLLLGAAGTVAVLALAACSPGTPSSDSTATGGSLAAASDPATITFRLWDELAAPAYEESFDAFMAEHPDILVEVEVVPWGEYWERLPRDLAAREMADVFWTDSASVGRYIRSGDLVEVGEALGEDHDAWEPAAAELYERDAELWGVPQLWESGALFYNSEMVEAADVDPATLRWAPGTEDEDTLLDAARALTTDAAGRHPGEEGFDPTTIETYGFHAQADPRAVYLDFLGQNGARYQDGARYTFASPEGEEAFQYLVDLVNTHHVAPPTVATDDDGDAARDLFVGGRLALLQSGPGSLRAVHDNADFTWGLAPMVAGPEGRRGVVHSVAAVGNAASDNPAATTEVLRWLGSAQGQQALASRGLAFPAAVDAQHTFVEYWAERGVDVEVFLRAAQEPTVPAPVGPDPAAGADAIVPVLREMFLGRIPVPEALAEAEAAGNAAIAD